MLSTVDDLAHISCAECIECGSCEDKCPENAIVRDNEYDCKYRVVASLCQGGYSCNYVCFDYCAVSAICKRSVFNACGGVCNC